MEEIEKFCERIRDSEIRAGFRAAVYQNLLPARTDREYAGHFSITSDGRSFGTENTWPGLDSWQMTGAYLALGQTAPALGTFRFVRASQREDGNLPFQEYAERWLARQVRYAPGTLESYRRMLERVYPFIGNI